MTAALPPTRTATRLRHRRHGRPPVLGIVAPPTACCGWSVGVAWRRQRASFMTSSTPAQLLNHACERRQAVQYAGGNEKLI